MSVQQLSPIAREPHRASDSRFDLIIVGGGIYGAQLAMEATRRGWRSLLLEREDYGGGTSANWLRILHGGLRYLQKMDLPRFFDSVNERQYFLRHFAAYARPLECIMPLSGEGLRRPSVMRAALTLNDALSWRRNRDVPAPAHLPGSGVLSPQALNRRLPALALPAHAGAACWHDAWVSEPQRLLIDTLRMASTGGSQALNYLDVQTLTESAGRVNGVFAHDRWHNQPLRLQAPRVILATGPTTASLLAQWGGALGDQLAGNEWSIAWNVLFDVSAPDRHAALALTPPAADCPDGIAQTYFLLPCAGRLLAGTGHARWAHGAEAPPKVSDQQLQQFVHALNSACPSLGLHPDKALRVFAGLLPAEAGPADHVRLLGRPSITDFAASGGPTGLYAVSGVKYTTARSVACSVLDQCGLPERERRHPQPPLPLPSPENADDIAALGALESARDALDIALRRVATGDDLSRLPSLLAGLAAKDSDGGMPIRDTPESLDPRLSAAGIRKLPS